MDRAINNRQIVCRTCLKIRMDHFNIYDQHNNEKAIFEKLMECTNIKVNKNDGLPMNICINCLEKLNLAYDFRNMVVETDKSLYNFYINGNKRKLEFSELSNEGSLNKDEDSIMDIGETDIQETLLLENDRSYSDNVIRNDNKLEQIDITNRETSFSNNDANICVEYSSDNLWQHHINKITAINCNKGEKQINMKVLLDNNCDRNRLPVDSDASKYSTDSKLLKVNNNLMEKDIVSALLVDGDKYIEENEDIGMESPIKSLNISEYEHLRTILSEKEKLRTRLFCKECNKSFRFKYYFEVHLPQHIGKLPYKCNLCDKAFSIPYLLRKHGITHSNNKPYKCKVCKKAFKYQGGLQAHMSVHTGNLLYKCPVCNKAFRQNGNLTAHVRRHKPEREFTCEICGKSFVDKVGLSHHSETHNTEKKCVCSICGKAYKTSKCLSRHVKSHAEVKDHKCNYCDKTFHTTSLLTQHISTHTGERPFPCKLCNKMFRQRATLFRHMRVHTGESPFACESCPEKFKYSHHLASHVKVHHK